MHKYWIIVIFCYNSRFMFASLPDIWSVISRKVVLVVCGRKIKNSWLNHFFYQSSKLPDAKVLDT